MKLKINGFANELKFYDDKINILCIKNTKCFTNIIQKINNKIEGIENEEIFLLDDMNEELKMQKEVLMIIDLFNIDFNSKKILGKLYDKISDSIENSDSTKIQNMLIEIRKSIIDEINEFPFEFTMSDNIDIVNMLKLYDLKIDKLAYESILEKIEFLIDLNTTLNIFSIIVIPNLKIYLSQKELIELYKYSLYNNVKLLLIEKNIDNKLEYEQVLVIDESFDDYII